MNKPMFTKSFTISIHALREEGDDKAVFVLLLVFISIHALREEGDCSACPALVGSVPISIHALREEGDASTFSKHNLHCFISIHALREEGDWQTSANKPFSIKFLSTPSARRATRQPGTKPRLFLISIHALREEGDHCPH